MLDNENRKIIKKKPRSTWGFHVGEYAIKQQSKDASNLHYYAFAFSVDVVATVIAKKRVFCHAIYSKERYDPANLLLCVGVLFYSIPSYYDLHIN